MSGNAKLTEGSVSQTILSQTGPMIIGMLGIVIFNLADTYFIGKLGTEALAAMSFTLPVVMLQGAIAMGLGVGTSAVVSHAIGTGDNNKVKRLTTDSLLLSVLIVLIIITIGLFTITPLFTAMGAEGSILEMVRDYITIWYLGVPFVVIPMIGNNAIRAAGNTVIPSTIMMIAVVINVILDPVLIFGIGPIPAMGMKGAAFATVFARFTTLIASLLFLRFKFNMLTIKLENFSIIKTSWFSILHIGMPSALTQVLVPISVGVITKMVAGYGKDAVAALGVASRLEMFALSPTMALSATMIPFIGQNAGANRNDRVRKGIYFSYKVSIVTGLVGFLIFSIFGRQLAGIFDSNKDVVEIVYSYLLIVFISHGFLGIIWICASSFSALRKPFNSTYLNFIKMFLLYIPLAILGARLFDLNGIFTGASLSSFLGGAIGIFWVNRLLDKI